MSLTSYIGTERNILAETPEHCHTLKMPHPVLTNRDLEKLRRVSRGDLLASTLTTTFCVHDGEAGLKRALDSLCRRASLAIKSGYTLLILSDRGIDEEFAPIPSLLALTAVHNHLVREGTRTGVALIVESGEPREVMHYSLLIGYGASAINPYLAIETIEELDRENELPEGITSEVAIKNYVKAVNKGLLKIFSKMGMSTVQSYCGAQIFDAVGLRTSFVKKYFTGTHTQIEGIGLREIAHGRWEGKTREEVEREFAEEYTRYEHDPYSFAPSGGESGLQVTARAAQQGRTLQLWLVTLTRADDGKTVARGPVQPVQVGRDQVVPDQLHAATQPAREFFPTIPVIFAESIFYRNDRISREQVFIELDHLRRRERSLFGFWIILSVLHEFGCGGIQGDGNVGSGFVAGAFNRVH